MGLWAMSLMEGGVNASETLVFERLITLLLLELPVAVGANDLGLSIDRPPVLRFLQFILANLALSGSNEKSCELRTA